MFLIVVYSLFSLPDYSTFKREYFNLSDGAVLDKDQYPLSIVRQEYDIRRVGYARISEVNTSFLNLLIQSEDKRFYSHCGVDFIAFLSTFKEFLTGKKIRGASTINMQFVRNYFNLSKESSILRKLKEIYYALIIDFKWSKDEILEAYINTVPIRGEISGVYTASLGLFEKSCEYINDVESVIILSLIRRPSMNKSEITKMAIRISKNLGLNINEDKIKRKVAMLPDRYIIPKSVDYLPVLSERLLRKHKSPLITTIDINIQKKAIEILKSFVANLKAKNLNDAALIVVENRTAEIVAYVPNAFELSSKKYVDGVMAKRQAGSTLKPFLYEYLIHKNLLTAASILDDSPIFIGKNGSIYSPQNYDQTYRGLVSVRTALASSLNIPAVRAISIAGVENFTLHLDLLGFDTDRSKEIVDYYGESLALGSIEVSLYELVRAYTTLANGGIYKDLKILKTERSEEVRILDERSVYIVQHILSDRDARSLTFDLENTLSTPFYTAVKTGTSKDMRDNWCIGFSQQYTVGVWTGNFSGEPMYDVSGSHGASQIWFALMKEIHKKVASKPPRMPNGVVKKVIKFVPPIEPEREEFFISKTEPQGQEIIISDQKIPKIIYPPDQSIFALDPSLPLSQQKLYIHTTCNNCLLYSDNNKIGEGKNIFIIDITRGRHSLELVDPLGIILDKKEYEVR